MSLRILVVDDDPNIVKIIRLQLEGEGFRVETAQDGEEALQKISHSTPDLVLLDLAIPRKSGWDVIEDMRGRESTRHIPVLLLTASSRTQVRLTAQVHGVPLKGKATLEDEETRRALSVDYLVKPHRKEDLIRRILEMVERRVTG